MKKSVKLACHAANSNNAIGSLLTLPSIARICALLVKIMKFHSYSPLKYRGGCTLYNTVASIKCMM